MRVVTTYNKVGFDLYGHRCVESFNLWPEGAELKIYSEDSLGIPFPAEFVEWKAKHQGYAPPAWQWDVVKYSHKVFAAIDALYDYDGIGVWLDADCVTFKEIPAGLIEKQVEGVYLAHYGRTGLYTETGLWIVDCKHPQHKQFMDSMRSLYLTERYRQLAQWHDCFVLDAAIRLTGVPTFNLSGELHKDMHPMAKTELGQYLDHCKGTRKIKGRSPENRFRT